MSQCISPAYCWGVSWVAFGPYVVRVCPFSTLLNYGSYEAVYYWKPIGKWPGTDDVT